MSMSKHWRILAVQVSRSAITIHSRTVFQYIIHIDSRPLKMVNHCVIVDAHTYGTCPCFRRKNEKITLKNDAKINWSVKTLLHRLSTPGYGLLM